jgi:pyruvate/2-oxoacid:ferredoxin oxidoreductase alpha subunit
MEQARDEVKKADREFEELFGRSYGLVEPYRCDDAELIIVASGTISGTTRLVVDELRDQGKKIGLLRIRLFRPFPMDEVREILKGAKKVCVIDRNISFGHHGVFHQEVKSSLYNSTVRPPILGFIAGLGGRDVTPGVIKEIVDYTEKHEESEDKIWIGVKR